MATRWLFKTEPSVYSYQQLVKDKKTMWDGVANNLALMHLKDIKKGEQIFIYHTGDEKQAVGIARALGGAYSDPEKDNPRMLVVDIEPVKALAKPVTLAEVKADKKLAKFDLVRNSRLSIMKLTEEQWDAMMEMSKNEERQKAIAVGKSKKDRNKKMADEHKHEHKGEHSHDHGHEQHDSMATLMARRAWSRSRT